MNDLLFSVAMKYVENFTSPFKQNPLTVLSMLVGYPGQQRAKVAELSRFGRPVSKNVVPL